MEREGKGRNRRDRDEKKDEGEDKEGERTSEITSFTTLDQSSSSRNEQSTSTLSYSLYLPSLS